MKDSLKVGIIAGLITVITAITIAYAAISGNVAISVVDPAAPLKYYTVPGTVANGMYVDVRRIVSMPTVTTTQGTTPWVVGQSVQGNLLMTAYQPTATNLNMTAAQPTASLLNATITPASGVTITVNPPTPSNSSFTTIEYEHAMIHAGKHFQYTDYQAISNGTSIDYLITTPSTSSIHLGYHVQTDQRFTAYLYESPTYGSLGTSQTTSILNNNRQSATTAKMGIYSTPSITTVGTTINIDLIGSSGSVGNAIATGEEIITKLTNTYLMRVTNTATGTGIYVIHFEWYEL